MYTRTETNVYTHNTDKMYTRTQTNVYTHTDKCIHTHRQTETRKQTHTHTHTQRPTSLFNLIPTSFEEFSLLDDSCTDSSTGTSSRPCLSHLSLSRTSTLSQNQTISLCVSDFPLTFTLKIFCLFASSSISPPTILKLEFSSFSF